MNLTKTLSRRTLLLVILAGFVLSLAFMLRFILTSTIQSSPAQLTVHATALHKQQVSAGLPVHLKIPKINVDAALDYVGLTPQGALGVPVGPTDAAWYDQGPRPGERGDAIIDGHFGWKNNIPAVFDNLHALQKGDDIYVEDAKGVTTTFVVRTLQTYTQNENATGIFVSSDRGVHLNLITCQGVWNNTQQSYSNRLVVFADKVT